MQRENRYLVLKIKDIEAYLSADQHEQLDDLRRAINLGRLLAGKDIVQCVVVEDDWPEYEPTWAAIEKRVDATPNVEVSGAPLLARPVD